MPLKFTDEGEGPAVVMLHAFGGSSVLWENNGLMPLDGFRTITFDARGHGESGIPNDAGAYGTELVDDIVRVMDARGVNEAHIVGYSMGAETALKLTTEYPGRILSLVIAGSGWSGDEEAQFYGFLSGALKSSATFGDFMAAMPQDEDVTEEEMLAGFAMLQAHGITPEQRAEPLAATAGAMGELIGLSHDTLAGISVPVLGLAGETDEERDNVEHLADAIPNFTFVMIPESDHLSAPLAPLFTETVISFLRN